MGLSMYIPGEQELPAILLPLTSSEPVKAKTGGVARLQSQSEKSEIPRGSGVAGPGLSWEGAGAPPTSGSLTPA